MNDEFNLTADSYYSGSSSAVCTHSNPIGVCMLCSIDALEQKALYNSSILYGSSHNLHEGAR
jgi:hypothetical protein